MAEIKISFDLTFSRRFVRGAGVVAIMLCAVPELESESVTLSTYYPAPSGVYTQMITTGNTYLARDTGNVGIGTAAPTFKLDVSGAANASGNITSGANISAVGSITAGGQFNADNSDLYFRKTNHNHTGIGNTSGYAAIENSSDYDTLMILGRADGNGNTNGMRTVDVWDKMNVNGNLNVTGPIQSRQGAAGCIDTSHTYATPAGGSITMCAAGRYVTMIDGIYAKRSIQNVVIPSAGSYTIHARCCLCPLVNGVSVCAGM